MSEPTAISASALNPGAAAPPTSHKVKTLYSDLKLAIEDVPIESLKADKRALRTHSPSHIEQFEAFHPGVRLRAANPRRCERRDRRWARDL